MGYEFNISRDQPITLEEWKNLVSNHEHLRPLSEPTEITNPKTKEVIKIMNVEGDTQVFFATEKKWYSVFRYSNGSISFNYTSEWDNKNSTTREIAFDIAKELGAKIIGDSGVEIENTYPPTEYIEVTKKKWWQFWH